MAPRLLFHFNCYSALNCSIKCGPWHGGNNGLIRGHFHLIRRNKPLAAVQWCSPRLASLKAVLSVWRKSEERWKDKHGQIQRFCVFCIWKYRATKLSCLIWHSEVTLLHCVVGLAWSGSLWLVSCRPLITMLCPLLSPFWNWQRSRPYHT